MSEKQPIIKTFGLCRFFQRGTHEVRALSEVDIAVPGGEFVAIVGSSGSGKSTLLAALAGLDTPTAGTIEINGTSLASLTSKELARYRAIKVGMIFQSFNLIRHRTALENVELALYFDDTPPTQRLAAAGHALQQLGLADRLDHRPADLSGGEQQRVAIARAIVKNPQILFADEPTGNLDHEHSLQIGTILADLNRQGMTIVMVTHDLAMARRYAQRIIRLDYGRVTEVTRT